MGKFSYTVIGKNLGGLGKVEAKFEKKRLDLGKTKIMHPQNIRSLTALGVLLQLSHFHIPFLS